MRGSTDGAEGKTPKWRRVGLLLDDASGWSELLIPAYRFDRVRRRSGSEHYLLSRLSVEFRNSPPNAGPPSSSSSSSLPLPHPFTTGSAVEVAGLDEIDNRGIKKQQKKRRIVSGFTPRPAALEWCLPVWRGFTFYWRFYRFVQVIIICWSCFFFLPLISHFFLVKIGDRGVSK